jgi:hypothetical protein
MHHHEMEGSILSLHRYYDFAAHAYVCRTPIIVQEILHKHELINDLNSRVNVMVIHVHDQHIN